MLSAILRGDLGQIITPGKTGGKGGKQPAGETVQWVADNAVFTGRYPGDEVYLNWLSSRNYLSNCRFATAPDVVCDAEATTARALPILPKIRALGLPAAYVAQNGATIANVPWSEFDALFIGGDTDWKLGPEAARLVAEAKSRGLWVHMGRVNTFNRLDYATILGCDSVDGTMLAFAPDDNLTKLLAWLWEVNGTPIWEMI